MKASFSQFQPHVIANTSAIKGGDGGSGTPTPTPIIIIDESVGRG